MPPTIDDSTRALLDEPNFAHVSTLRKDGSVHNAVVWLGAEGDEILLNSAQGRVWPDNIARDPRVTISVHRQDKPYEYAMIRGRVVDTTTDGADAHIDALAKKYLDADTYPFRQEGEVRLKMRVVPEKVMHWGG